jgi:4-hydroxybenzoate polyprenyltransferase
MMGNAGTFRTYAELARVSNLPTCVSNTLVGCALGARSGLYPWASVPPIAAGICLLYVAGMVMNDIFDRRSDWLERPERPIPSGRVSLLEAWSFAGMTLVLGMGLLSNASTRALDVAFPLVASIVLYDLLHKRYAWSIVLMGICRGMVYLVAAAGVSWPFDFFRAGWLAGTLALYTVVITVVARSENIRMLDARRWLALALPPVVLANAWVVQPQQYVAAAAAGLLLVLWLGRAARAVLVTPPNTKSAILLWISGMCLVDAFFLALLEQPLAALLALLCFGLTVYSHRHIAGT